MLGQEYGDRAHHRRGLQHLQGFTRDPRQKNGPRLAVLRFQDAYGRSLEINVAPPEPEQLTPADSGRERERNRCVHYDGMLACLAEDGFQLLVG